MKQIILFILSISIGVVGLLLIRSYSPVNVGIIPFTVFGIALIAAVLLWGCLKKKKSNINTTYLSLCILAVVIGTDANFLIRSSFGLNSNVLELSFQAILTLVCIMLWGRMRNNRMRCR